MTRNMRQRMGLNNFHATENSPNPAKFLKEMEALVPKLKAKGIIPMNREEARAMGEKGTVAAAIAAEKEHERRLYTVGLRIDEHMAYLSPLAFRLVTAFRWAWIFKALGYSYDIRGTSETVEGVEGIACTQIRIYRRWFPLFQKRMAVGERLVWEEPKLKAPKSRIIKP